MLRIDYSGGWADWIEVPIVRSLIRLKAERSEGKRIESALRINQDISSYAATAAGCLLVRDRGEAASSETEKPRGNQKTSSESSSLAWINTGLTST